MNDVLSEIRNRRRRKQITEDFRNYLLTMIFALGDVHDQVESSTQMVERFVAINCREATVRRQVLLNEVIRRMNEPMTDRQRAAEFTFEYFFVLHDDFSSDIQIDMRDDFMQRIHQAFNANGIYRS